MISPNTIDFKKAVNELSQIDETGNVIVLVVVLFIFVLYCIMLMVVKRMDKSNLRKVCSIIVTNKNNKNNDNINNNFNTINNNSNK